MLFPLNFARERIYGQTIRKGWKVRVGSGTVFVARDLAQKPGRIRKMLELALGIDREPKKTADQMFAAAARRSAVKKRAYRNQLALGKPVYRPWEKKRTLRAIKNEERMLDIANKWQRMGEYRR